MCILKVAGLAGPRRASLVGLGGGSSWPREAGLAGVEPDGPRMRGPNGPRASRLDKSNN